MSKTGRPPKPLQEKILSGSRIRNDRDEDAQVANAAVDLGMPPCPGWVKGAAKKHWDVLGPQLVQQQSPNIPSVKPKVHRVSVSARIRK